MAICIPIAKESEDDHTVVYTYARENWERDENSREVLLSEIGRIGVDKDSGEIVPLAGILHDAFYLPRATRMIREAVEKKTFAERLDYMA